MKLARKLVVAFLLVVCAVFAAYASVRVNREIRLFDTDMRRDAENLGRSLALAMAEVWRVDGEATALRVVTDADAQSKDIRIRWIWLDGGALPPRLDADGRARLSAGVVVFRDEPSADGAGHLYTYLPVTSPAGRRGALEVGESLREEQAFIRATLLTTLLTTAVLIGAFGLVAMGIGTVFVGRPIHRLIDQARRIGAGDLSQRLVVAQEDEIAELAAEMNLMCDRLVAANDAIAAATSAKIAALEQLRHAERLGTVGKLASGIAHELGTPLNVVSGRAKMIASGELTGDDVPTSARVIAEQSERMARIIRQLLDFARRRQPAIQTGDLRVLVRTTTALLQSLAHKQRVELVADEGEPFPAEFDEGQLQQALTNLVVNGVQAMRDGGTLRVDLSKVRRAPPPDVGGVETDYVRIAVTDDGKGMDADTLAHVFEPFFTTKGVGEGTGLGLSVAYGIAREHGGWVDASSELGEGSVFSIYIPWRQGT